MKQDCTQMNSALPCRSSITVFLFWQIRTCPMKHETKPWVKWTLIHSVWPRFCAQPHRYIFGTIWTSCTKVFEATSNACCRLFLNQGHGGPVGGGSSREKIPEEAEVSNRHAVLQRWKFTAQHQVAFSLWYTQYFISCYLYLVDHNNRSKYK